MRFMWKAYDPDGMPYVERWLDETAIKSTGLEEGWQAFHEYWTTEGGMTIGEDYWCKVVFNHDTPFAIIALSEHEGNFHIMELLVKPEMRGKGLGTALLYELLSDSISIIGHRIGKATAAIFANNLASQKTFEKVGFTFDHADATGDTDYYMKSI